MSSIEGPHEFARKLHALLEMMEKLGNADVKVDEKHSNKLIKAYKSVTKKAFKMPDINDCEQKTPVTILQEIGIKNSVIPTYEVLHIEGKPHEPIFCYRAEYTDKEHTFVGVGKGTTKKLAKQISAREILDQMQLASVVENKCQDGALFTDCDQQNEMDISYPSKHFDLDIFQLGCNPVGWLQEVCVDRKICPPTYELVSQAGMPHDPIFTLACVFQNIREIGTRSTKRLAKRDAAQKMRKRLLEKPYELRKLTEKKVHVNDIQWDN